MLPGFLCRFMDIVMDKLSLHVLAFSLLVVQASCGQRRPGMSREEATSLPLSRQWKDEEIVFVLLE